MRTMEKKIETNKLRTSWTKFFAIIILINGAGLCLSIVFIPVGIPIILASLKLYKAAELGDQYIKKEDTLLAEESMKHFLDSFRIFGRTIIYSALALVVIVILVGIFYGFTELENIIN